MSHLHTHSVIGVLMEFIIFSFVICSCILFLGRLYFTKVKLGSPPTEFNVQIDTGSDILWVTCSSCSNCPHSSGLGIDLHFFDAPGSLTAGSVTCSDPICSSVFQTTAAQCSENNQCGYSFRYGDGSGTSGYYMTDTFYFDAILGESLVANSSAPIVFGCSTYQSGDLTKSDKAVDGIFGFGKGKLSVVSQLSSRGITPPVFSHCLKGDGSGGGVFVLGEILVPGMVYSPLVPSQPHYNLNLLSIGVNGQMLPLDAAVFEASNTRGTIVDTGTTLTYLVKEAYDLFLNAISNSVSQLVTPIISNGEQCYLVSTSISDMFPSVSLNFAGGASMMLRPQDYLFHYGIYDGASMWCIGFQKAPEEQTILGDLVLKDKVFVYDLARQRIGWASYDCSMSVNVSITSGKDIVNSGQPCLNISTRDILIRLFFSILFGLLLCIFFSLT
ncbi:Eukaryotic aspartyl protease family protein [Arabidopsis thaliana]|uniref:Eukaryotic aspartyl protease family protein n=1 Tax=Arabidopsis thaliana TaxID=3702 RepID=A0A1P8AXQ7_ARATH|nr:Eukaryotic aspartyl protease family protein [Arabidopsis thaliana]NP_001323661.1 Eukaryotic aspartyl protease family protein [Arabidopsis thaliana]ANM61443.1 Eukaryotic aspartyl protease family protein [Arabidopsis thaliana]ANM61444.1 Eukaryotic aspartyl protease family protein [Arabidopsis thaliana]|eukprot:NP_001323660.1 Eukaryotic aspartyl protease family protein [Arabidopsis thaliana]